MPLAGFRLTVACVLATFAGVIAPAKADRKPNLVIILMDDMGYGDIGPFNPAVQEPHAEPRPHGARGDEADVVLRGPGLHAVAGAAPHRLLRQARVAAGRDLPGRAKVGLSAEEHTIAGLLKEQGYATMAVGKWHVGDQPEFLPTRRGFDHYLGLPYSNDMGGEWDGAADVPRRPAQAAAAAGARRAR